MRKVNNTRAKKLVRWHDSYVVFLTPEDIKNKKFDFCKTFEILKKC